jgi:4-hydroxy-3-methylbut-2-enyl diphosphate reductase
MKILLAKPRGFCAGVERAIKCVESALSRYGAPVYVLNDIVHNSHVVNDLREKGAIFVKRIEDVPPGSHLLFSAHGVGLDRYEQARELDMEVVDATCPLVEKVHNEARRFAAKGHTIILIGEEGHDEVIGTMGWAPQNIRRVLTVEDVEALEAPEGDSLSYITQTTLSVADCQRVIEALKRRFPEISGPPKADICYATSNRQAAIREIAHEAELVLVVGDVESGNSNRLADICRDMGKPAYLISDVSMIDAKWLEGVETIALTAGASAPERLVEEVIAFFQSRGPCEVVETGGTEESVIFRLPVNIA